jgi:sporulation protein YlmC with PRC-barrel domain
MAPDKGQPTHYYLSEQLLDRQLVDFHGVRCGKVDDVEFDDSTSHRIVALWVGPEAWLRRFPDRVQPLVRPIRRFGAQRVAWDQVYEISDDEVRLRDEAMALGLSTVDEALARRVSRIPLGN